MEFEWDEAKRLGNLGRHGFDFRRAVRLFQGPHVVSESKVDRGEMLFLATGFFDDVCVTVVYTMRGDVTRVISIRRARHDERRRYQAVHGH